MMVQSDTAQASTASSQERAGDAGARAKRGETLLDFIFDQVDQRINPGGEECWHCGGEGVTFDCIDGCCVDAESGCEDCERPCIECKINAGRRAKAVREEVIKANDIDIAVAWLKHIGRWREDLTDEDVTAAIRSAAATLAENKPAIPIPDFS